MDLASAILCLRSDLALRLEQRAALEAAAADPVSWFAAIPRDIVRHVILPYLPDLRRNRQWMQLRMARAEMLGEEFLDNYGAINSKGQNIYYGFDPILNSYAASTLMGISDYDKGYGKFINGVWVTHNDRCLLIYGDTTTRLELTNPVCRWLGGDILQVCADRCVRINLSTGEVLDRTDTCLHTNYLQILPCGLVLSHYYLLNPELGTEVPISIDTSCYYDDFGQTTTRPENGRFHDEFDCQPGAFYIQ